MDSVIMQLTSPSALVVSAPTTGRTRGKSLNRSSGNRTRGASGGGSSTTDRFSLDRQDQSGPPVVENTPGSNNDVAYACPVCGQMFALQDRLAKHMASRHKSRSTDGCSGASGGTGAITGGGSTSCGSQASSSSTKAFICDVCKRCFARSDMLTRHMRLHTGLKPYTCRLCGQVFSRSDHLSTHQRTHTGEKPYRCPSCPYAACRRDMITRHMRTHARYELQQDSTSSVDEVLPSSSLDSPLSVGSGIITASSRSLSSESAEPLPHLSQVHPGTGVTVEDLGDSHVKKAIGGGEDKNLRSKPSSPMDTNEEETGSL